MTKQAPASVETVTANGVVYTLVRKGNRWGVRYTYLDGSTDQQWKRTERDARDLFTAMVRGAQILAMRKTP